MTRKRVRGAAAMARLSKAAAPGRSYPVGMNNRGKLMPRVTPMKEMGGSGTAIFGGFISRKDSATGWYGKQRYEISSAIVSNISIVAASVRHFLNLIAKPKWKVVPTSDKDPQAREIAEFIEDVLANMETPLPAVVRRAGTFQFHGFGIQEWTAVKRPDGRIGLRSIESRPQHTIERWEVADNGSVLGVWQRSPQTNALLGIPRSKFVYAVDDTFTDSPEGLGIFRQLLEPYQRLKALLDLETRTFERDLRGIPVGRAPLAELRKAVEAQEITEDEAKTWITAMKDFIETQVKDSETAVLLDSQPFTSVDNTGEKISSLLQWSVDLLQGSANGLAELNTAIDRIQREMARIIGTEHLMMGDQGGNRALATDKSRNLYLVGNAVLNTLTTTFDQDVIRTIVALNGFPEELTPWFQAEDVSFKDVEQITTAMRDMATAGAVLSPDDPAIDDVRDLLGVSRPVPMEDGMTVLPLEEDSTMDDTTDSGNPAKPAPGAKRKRIKAK